MLVEHNGYGNELSSLEAESSYRKTNIELRKAYKDLQAEGIKNLYYLTKEEIGFHQDAMVEGVHPSDLGMQIYADAYISKIKEILKGNTQIISEALMNEMMSLAADMKFEEAQKVKEKYELIETYRSKSEVVSSVLHNIDVFSIETDESTAYINYLHITNG